MQQSAQSSSSVLRHCFVRRHATLRMNHYMHLFIKHYMSLLPYLSALITHAAFSQHVKAYVHISTLQFHELHPSTSMFDNIVHAFRIKPHPSAAADPPHGRCVHGWALALAGLRTSCGLARRASFGHTSLPGSFARFCDVGARPINSTYMDSSIDAPLHLCLLYFLLYFAFCFNWINYACEVRLFVPCSIFVYLFILFDSGHAYHRF